MSIALALLHVLAAMSPARDEVARPAFVHSERSTSLRPCDRTSGLANGDDKLAKADELFAEFDVDEKIEPLRAAATLLDELEKAEPARYDIRWRRARAYQALGEAAPKKDEKLELFDRAIESGKRAIELAPNAVEGHYWLGVSYGGYGEAKGMLKALSMIDDIRREMNAVIKIDAKYEDASAYLVLGRIDFELPGMFGGSDKRAIEEYEQGLKLAPNNAVMKLYLADSYLDGRKDDAKKLLEELIALKADEHSPRDVRRAQREAKQSFEKHFAKKKRRNENY
jgi:tetratricopeptide (TPR) repeat protein